MLRRKEPLHERLAREGGLSQQQPVEAPRNLGRVAWGEAGIHGISRPRRWDAVAVAEGPELDSDEVRFVALPDGTLLVDDGYDVAEGALEPLADAIEGRLPPPYRAEVVRRGEHRFAVAARGIDVVQVTESVEGDEIELTVHGGERELKIDGARSFGSVRSFERLAERRFTSYALRAERLEGQLWEVSVEAL
jgi:hypothetical protein